MPRGRMPVETTTLLVRGQPLPIVMAVMGLLLLATLAIRRFSLQLGAPAILGVLIFGLLIPNSMELFHDSTITKIGRAHV